MMILLRMLLTGKQDNQLFAVFPVDYINESTANLFKSIQSIVVRYFKGRHARHDDISGRQYLFNFLDDGIDPFSLIDARDVCDFHMSKSFNIRFGNIFRIF